MILRNFAIYSGFTNKKIKQKYELCINIAIYGLYSLMFFLSIIQFLKIQLKSDNSFLIANSAFAIAASLFLILRAASRLHYVDSCFQTKEISQEEYRKLTIAHSLEMIGVLSLTIINITLLIQTINSTPYPWAKYIQPITSTFQLSSALIIICILYKSYTKQRERQESRNITDDSNGKNFRLLQSKKLLVFYSSLALLFSFGAFIGDTIYLLESSKFLTIENHLDVIKDITGDFPIVGLAIKFFCLCIFVLFSYLGYLQERKIDNNQKQSNLCDNNQQHNNISSLMEVRNCCTI